MSIIPKILVVEDDAAITKHIVETIASIDENIQVKVVTNKEDAFVELENAEIYDLLNLDLTIPENATSSNEDIKYGNQVLRHSRNIAFGLPIFILTGSSTDEIVSDLLNSSELIDIWSENKKRSTVSHLKKLYLNKYKDQLKEIIDAVKSLGEIEVTKIPKELNVSEPDDRLIRLFAKRQNCSRCEVSAISGGLSGTRVYRIDFFNSSGQKIWQIIAKMGSQESIDTEHQNHNKYIQRLKNGVTPRKIETVKYGAMKTGAVFYSLAADYNSHFFQLEKIDERLRNNLQSLTEEWMAENESSRSVKNVRRLLLGDQDAKEIIRAFDLDWAEDFESNNVQTRWGCIHGDMHGRNILCNLSSNELNLIDYGDIMEGSCSLDPITLEFSFFFHPDGTETGEWPKIEQAEQWFDQTVYLDGCPIDEVIKVCRDWLNMRSVADRDRAASAYAYFLRQLKYEDTDKPLALAFLKGARTLFNQT